MLRALARLAAVASPRPRPLLAPSIARGDSCSCRHVCAYGRSFLLFALCFLVYSRVPSRNARAVSARIRPTTPPYSFSFCLRGAWCPPNTEQHPPPPVVVSSAPLLSMKKNYRLPPRCDTNETLVIDRLKNKQAQPGRRAGEGLRPHGELLRPLRRDGGPAEAAAAVADPGTGRRRGE